MTLSIKMILTQFMKKIGTRQSTRVMNLHLSSRKKIAHPVAIMVMNLELIKKTTALVVKTKASNFFVFQGELVVVRDLLVLLNLHFRIDYDLFAAVRPVNHLRVTVRNATMINETR